MRVPYHKIGDLIKNTHTLDYCGLGIIVDIDQDALDNWKAGYLVYWLNPPADIEKQTWNTDRWLEKINGSG